MTQKRVGDTKLVVEAVAAAVGMKMVAEYCTVAAAIVLGVHTPLVGLERPQKQHTTEEGPAVGV